MPQRLSLRRRRHARRRHLAAAAVLACALGGGAAVFTAGPLAPRPIAAQGVQQVCVSPAPILRCKPSPSSGAPNPPPSSNPGNPTPSHSGGGGGGHPQPSYSSGPGSTSPAFVPPSDTPLPTLPPPSPGTPPEPPELQVQSISLLLASAPPAKPGDDVLVQATLEAARGSDTYSVPHAAVSFTVTAQSGRGANVIPEQTDSGDTGVVLVTVVTGDKPGDTVVHAEAGSGSGDLTIHMADSPSPSPTSAPAVAAGPVKNGPSDSRGYLVASLAALVVALMAGYIAAMALGRLPNPLQRRSVWGRRSSAPERQSPP